MEFKISGQARLTSFALLLGALAPATAFANPPVIQKDYPEPEDPNFYTPDNYDPRTYDDPTAWPQMDQGVVIESTDERFKHHGGVVQVEGGVLGCTRSFCQSGMATTPGPAVSAFLGGNIGGRVEVGASGSYGTLRAEPHGRSTPVDFFDVELPAELPLNLLTIQGVTLEDWRVGPSVRLHALKQGRFEAYVGSGFGYHRFTADYTTPIGKVALAFHGIDVPVEVGAGVHITKRLSVTSRFAYQWTHFGAVSVDLPRMGLVAPMGSLEQRLGREQGSLEDKLPHTWSVGLGFRLTL